MKTNQNDSKVRTTISMDQADLDQLKLIASRNSMTVSSYLVMMGLGEVKSPTDPKSNLRITGKLPDLNELIRALASLTNLDQGNLITCVKTDQTSGDFHIEGIVKAFSAVSTFVSTVEQKDGMIAELLFDHKEK